MEVMAAIRKGRRAVRKAMGRAMKAPVPGEAAAMVVVVVMVVREEALVRLHRATAKGRAWFEWVRWMDRAARRLSSLHV